MVDIARVFSPVVVLESGEARPKSSDRIRSASAKRISSTGTRRTPPRVSSAVSTVEINNQVVSRYATNAVTSEKDFEKELKKELATRKCEISRLFFSRNLSDHFSVDRD